MKKERLIIIGAGNVGGYISYNSSDFGNYEVLGFLDDDPLKHGLTMYGHTVLGPISMIDQYIQKNPLSVVIGIADPKVRKGIARLLWGRNIRFPNLIAKNTWISKAVKLGQGLIIYPGVNINYECRLEDFIIINMNCAVEHNTAISSFSTLAHGVNLGGFTSIGECVRIYSGACTRHGTTIGEYALVEGQSMVDKNVPAMTKVNGIPAAIYDSKIPILKPRLNVVNEEINVLSQAHLMDIETTG